MTSGEARIHEAIADANEKFMSAFERADPETLAALHTADARILPPGTHTLYGKQDIESFWTGAMQAGIKRAELKTLKLEQQGDVVIETGQASLYDETGMVIDDTKYLVIWKQEDMQWKIHLEIWNSDPATD